METMRIIHVSTATSWRGGEQQLAYLIGALQEKKIEQEVLCAADSSFAIYCDEKSIKNTTFKKTGSINLRAAGILAQLSSSAHNPIVHCHDSHAHNIAYFAALLFRNPAPVVIHRRVDFPVKTNIFSRAKYNHNSVKNFICVSAAIKRILIPALNDPGKATVIHSGIDLNKFKNLKDYGSLKKEFGLSDETVLIGNVAALAPHKDYKTFVRTAEILLKNNPDLRFVIVGDGPERKTIEAEIKTRQLGERILLTGFRNNIPELLKELDVLLLTSKTEGLGTTLLDAFAGGLPVVATRAGGIPEIVEHKVTGLLAETGDAPSLAGMVEMLLADENLRQNLVKNAIERVIDFDYRNTALKILDVYNQIKLQQNQD
ncbi:MAG: glycosyltransferase family 4 protein [Bacteroidales bacterium]|nr:glycosyltransferase family 4 protein [Bacteroidales bacterium]